MAKHKYIETPEALLELFEEYQIETKSNPRRKKIKGNKDFVIHDEDLERPLTLEGFRIWCFKSVGCVKQYFDNPDNRYAEYITICSYIKDIIRADQIEGGMVGQYNPSITQRLNGLVEKTDNKNENTNIEIKANFGGTTLPTTPQSE